MRHHGMIPGLAGQRLKNRHFIVAIGRGFDERYFAFFTQDQQQVHLHDKQQLATIAFSLPNPFARFEIESGQPVAVKTVAIVFVHHGVVEIGSEAPGAPLLFDIPSRILALHPQQTRSQRPCRAHHDRIFAD